MNCQRYLSHTLRSGALSRPHSGRLAFTLVELLMVIVIIGILTSLLVVASMSVITTSREAATKGTILKVHGMLKERLGVFSGHKTDPAQIASVVEIAAGDNKRAEIIARKIEFLRAFPQTWAEALRANLLNASDVPSVITPESESSEVLFFVLTSSNSLGMTPVDADTFNSNEVRDTNGNGKLEFVDGWGRPLRFYRWPTRLVRPDGYGSSVGLSRAKLLLGDLAKSDAQLGADPDDPIGLLTSSGWPVTTGASFSNQNSVVFEEGDSNSSSTGLFTIERFHTLGTFHAPLIVSVGADGELGLNEPSDLSTTTFGYLAHPVDTSDDSPLYDNISNYNFRSGGN